MKEVLLGKVPVETGGIVVVDPDYVSCAARMKMFAAIDEHFEADEPGPGVGGCAANGNSIPLAVHAWTGQGDGWYPVIAMVVEDEDREETGLETGAVAAIVIDCSVANAQTELLSGFMRRNNVDDDVRRRALS